jgi:hypothetical protein
MNRKPVTPPTPRQSRPLAQPKTTTARPLTAALMARCKEIRDASDGKIDNSSIAKELGTTPFEVSEWLNGYRSAPNSEKTIGFIMFFVRFDRNLVKNLTA